MTRTDSTDPTPGPRHRSIRVVAGLGVALFLGASLALAQPTVTVDPQVDTKPLEPAWLVDVQHIDTVGGQHELTHPYLPPLTTSRDQRIGLVRKRVGADKARFHLIAPERLDSELMTAGAGAVALAPAAIDVDASQFTDGVGEIAHFALCDTETASPKDCGDGSGNDCYELTVIAGAIDASGSLPELRLWSTPITVEVADPKQRPEPNAVPPVPEASLVRVDVDTGSRVGGPWITGLTHPNPSPKLIGGISTFHTPMVVGEGSRLLIVRFGAGSYFSWTDAESTPATHTGAYDPVYAVYDAGAFGPCDVRGWTNFRPLSYAPSDPDVNQDFGFAMNAYRQPDGAFVNAPGSPPGAAKDIPGRYLWVDRDADNVFFASLSAPLIDDSAPCRDSLDPAYPSCAPLYEIACADDPACDDACLPGDTTCLGPHSKGSEAASPHQGWMAMGLWTNGKMVLLDSRVNHTDFGLQGEEEHHRLVSLYITDDVPPADVAVQVGTGRDSDEMAPSPYGWIDTTVQFGSTEHFLNFDPQMVPRTPRDVVWQISAGSRTDEIAFDDLISQRTLIYSPMNAVKDMVGSAPYYDGIDHAEMRLQNAATSLRWQTPTHGQVVPPAGVTTEARIEHVALGGIHGRGFYLYPQTRVDYTIEPQADLDQPDWLLSIFVDPREVPSAIRRLLTLPSDAYIDLHGIWWARLCTVDDDCTAIELKKPLVAGQWSHLAFRLVPADGETAAAVELYQDGFLADSVEAPDGFAIGAGVLRLGAPRPGFETLTGQGFEGWVDELKLVEGPFSPEEVCNHARGSLVAVPHDYPSTADPCAAGASCAKDLLQPFASETLGRARIHQELHGESATIADWANTSADHYLCLVDYGSPLGISLAELDQDVRSLRRRLLFPEGPLYWGEPRPDSLANTFCGACHHAVAPKVTLKPDALELRPAELAYEDIRRQPMQPPAEMHGWVPAGYFDDVEPMTSFAFDPATSTEIFDRYVDDGPLFRWTFDEGAGGTATNWVLGRPGESTGDGTIHGATFVAGVAGRGHALDFDGSAHVEIDQPFDIDSGELTLAAWFRLAGGADSVCLPYVSGKFPCTLIAKSGAGTHARWSLRVFYDGSDWRAQFKVSSDGASSESISAVLDEDLATPEIEFGAAAWHHLAATFDVGSQVLELYLDGEPLNSRSVTGAALGTGLAHGVTLGARLNGSGSAIHPFVGALDDAHVFSRRLSDDEIEALATKP